VSLPFIFYFVWFVFLVCVYYVYLYMGQVPELKLMMMMMIRITSFPSQLTSTALTSPTRHCHAHHRNVGVVSLHTRLCERGK